MRRGRGLGTISFSIISGALTRRASPTCTSVTGSKARSGCSTRSGIARSNASVPSDGNASPIPSRLPLSKPCPASGARMPLPWKAAARMARPAVSSSTSSPEIRRLVAALAASASLLCSPLAAQDGGRLPTLEELIPDEAVADPEGWAQQGVPPEERAAEDGPGELQANSPLDELPLIDVPWPEDMQLPQLAPLEPEEDIQFADFDEDLPHEVMVDEERRSEQVGLVFPSVASLFPEREEFIDRFHDLSSMEELEDDGNAARLAAQAREDEDLLQRLLRVYGYYDAVVFRSVGGIEPGQEVAGGQPTVRFDIIPGTSYTYGAIDLGQLASATADYPMLRGSFEIQPGDRVLADTIVEERYDLDETLGENGYPFAAIREPELLIDHARTQGDLTMEVTPGGKYR